MGFHKPGSISSGGPSSLWEDIMGTFNKGFDFNGSFDDIIQAARDFGEKLKEMAPEMAPFPGAHAEQSQDASYPPTNVYKSRDGSMVLEFALAGLDESAVTILFQGDYLVLSAKVAPRSDEGNEGSYSMHGFKPRNIEKQKYRVNAEDFAQELSKAVFKNGVLTVTVPPKESESQGIKIEIVKEGI